MRTLLVTSVLFLSSAGGLFASHPRPYEMERIRAVAHELEEAARHVHREAERRRHHYDRAEAHAFARLHELERRARHFHRQVERYRQNPYHTERDFLQLRGAYFRAAEVLPALHGDRHVRRDFERVRYLMHLLDEYYVDRGSWLERRYD
ncbi:MAG: hypothetical protein R3244_13765, partial [Thermoanaerobaculia bacterium]|nr:hypothetical protein [Thermoanaerobaculia bacterium]